MDMKVPDAWDWMAHDIQRLTRAQILYLAIIEGELDGKIETNSRVFSYPHHRYTAIQLMKAVSRELSLHPETYQNAGPYRHFAEEALRRTKAKCVFLIVTDGAFGSGISLVGSPNGLPWIIRNFETIIEDYRNMSSHPHLH